MTNHPNRMSGIAAHHPTRSWIDPGDWNEAEYLATAIPATDRLRLPPDGYTADDGTGVLGRALSGHRAQRYVASYATHVRLVGSRFIPAHYCAWGNKMVALVETIEFRESDNSGLSDVPLHFGLHRNGDVTMLLQLGDSGGDLCVLGRYADGDQLATAMRAATCLRSDGSERPSLRSTLDCKAAALRVLAAGARALAAPLWRLELPYARTRSALILRDDFLLA